MYLLEWLMYLPQNVMDSKLYLIYTKVDNYLFLFLIKVYIYILYMLKYIAMRYIEKSYNFRGLMLKHFTHTELMNSIKSFANCINIIRGSTNYLVRKMQNINCE